MLPEASRALAALPLTAQPAVGERKRPTRVPMSPQPRISSRMASRSP